MRLWWFDGEVAFDMRLWWFDGEVAFEMRLPKSTVRLRQSTTGLVFSRKGMPRMTERAPRGATTKRPSSGTCAMVYFRRIHWEAHSKDPSASEIGSGDDSLEVWSWYCLTRDSLIRFTAAPESKREERVVEIRGSVIGRNIKRETSSEVPRVSISRESTLLTKSGSASISRVRRR
jgi:hypothetical protein